MECDHDLDSKPILSIDPKIEDCLLATRRVELIGEIDEYTAVYVNSHLRCFALEDPKLPVYIYISSPGGELSCGYSIVDQIMLSPFKIYTIVQGQAHSMAAIIAAYGTKGCRFATENSSLMIHSVLLSSTTDSIMPHKQSVDHLYADYQQKIAQLSKRTKLNYTKMFALMEKTHWMNPKEAMKIGMIDGVWTKTMEQAVNSMGIENEKKKKNN